MAYRAEIEVGVKGAQRLQELRDKIDKLSTGIDQVNAKTFFGTKTVASIRSYNNALADAQENLNKTRLRLNEAGEAAGNYAKAINQYVTALEASNGAQALTNRLIADEIELRRKQKLAASGIRETTQYGGPIGPGEASPIGALVGQASPVGERIKRIVDGKREQLELDRALFELERKSADELNEKVKLQNNLVEGTREVYELLAAYNREAATGIRPSTQYAGPIGPGPASPVDALMGQSSPVNERIARIRAYEAAAIDAANNVAQLAQEQEQKITQQELKNNETVFKQKLNQLIELGEVELQISKKTNDAALKDFDRRLKARKPQGGFPTEGMMASPGFKATQKSIGKLGESLALGAGFPLLFGGGAGSVAGSLLGSFVGSGFGGQILGGAIGQIIDTTLVKLQDIGNAIQGLNFDVLTNSGIRLNANLREQLDLLISIGEADKARQLISQQVATQTGTIAGTIEDVGNSVNILGDSWNKVTTTAGALLGMLSAPFAVALAGILEVVNAILYAINSMFAVFAKGLKTIGEFVVNLIGGEGASERLAEAIKKLNKELTDADVKAASLRNNLNNDNVRSLIELQAARKLTPGVTSEDKVTNIKVQAEKELNLLFQDRLAAVSKVREENKNASKETVDYLVTQTKAHYDNKRALVELNRDRKVAAELERQTADAAKKAAQERKKQLDEERAAYLRQLGAVSQAFTVTKQIADYDIQRTRFVEGESAALKEQLEQNNARLFIDKQLLDIQLKRALNTKNLTDKERELLQGTYTQQLQLLKDQSALKAQQLQLAIAELAVRRELAALESPRRQQDISQSRAGQIAGIEAQLAFPFGGDELERINQQQEQSTRYYETITPLERELSDLKLKRAETAAFLSKQDKELLDQQIAGKQAEIRLETQALTVLTQKENQLLRQQQILQQYKFVADEVSAAFSDAITGLITGTTTVAEAFSQMFANIGKAFIDMVTQMLAQAALLAVVKALLPGSSAMSANGFFDPMTGKGVAGPNYGLAKGGYVTGPTNALIGEGGEPEYVIPASKMSSAMARYSSGQRGSSVIAGAATTGGGGGQVIRFESTVINNVEYVTRSQAEAMSRQAAKQGAAGGYAKTMGGLRNSRATRARVGMG